MYNFFSIFLLSTDPYSSEYDKDSTISECKNAKLVERNGYLFQVGGPPVDENEDVSRDVIRGPGGWTFMAPFELSFVLNFTVIDNMPRGCGPLDGDWIKDQKGPYIKGETLKDGSESKKDRDWTPNR